MLESSSAEYSAFHMPLDNIYNPHQAVPTPPSPWNTENSKYDGTEQLNLFNEAEAERVVINPEPTVESITYQRKKKKGSREALL
ncbi:MAG: hypothetical protein LLG09_07355, partial [Negativicutes bacterium]|nr:hypothetical protein [Negativicutes bacterium]